jgi:hypothetical protein
MCCIEVYLIESVFEWKCIVENVWVSNNIFYITHLYDYNKKLALYHFILGTPALEQGSALRAKYILES